MITGAANGQCQMPPIRADRQLREHPMHADLAASRRLFPPPSLGRARARGWPGRASRGR